MRPERIVKQKHPEAVCLFSQFFKFWGVFLKGPPEWIGGPKGDWESFFASGTTKTEAWEAAAKLLEKQTNPQHPAQ